jgi:hypothetical protein
MVEVGRESQESTLRGRAYLRLVPLGGLNGIPAAFVAALFRALVNVLGTSVVASVRAFSAISGPFDGPLVAPPRLWTGAPSRWEDHGERLAAPDPRV